MQYFCNFQMTNVVYRQNGSPDHGQAIRQKNPLAAQREV